MINHQLAALDGLKECVMEVSRHPSAFRQSLIEAGADGSGNLPHAYPSNLTGVKLGKHRLDLFGGIQDWDHERPSAFFREFDEYLKGCLAEQIGPFGTVWQKCYR